MTDRNPDYHCPVCHKYICSGYPLDKRPDDSELAEKCGPKCLRRWRNAHPAKAGKKPRPERYGISKVTQFKAADGTLHDTWQAAVKHTTDTALERSLAGFFEEEHTRDGWGSKDDLKRLAAYLRAEWNLSRKRS